MTGASLAAQAQQQQGYHEQRSHPATRSLRQGTQQSASGSAHRRATGIGSMQSSHRP